MEVSFHSINNKNRAKGSIQISHDVSLPLDYNDYMLKNKLKQLRLEHGYTQEMLALKLKIKQYNITDYETGRIEPNIPILLRYADVFDVSLDELLERRTVDASRERNVREKLDYKTLVFLETLQSLDSDDYDKAIRSSQKIVDELLEKEKDLL